MIVVGIRNAMAAQPAATPSGAELRARRSAPPRSSDSLQPTPPVHQIYITPLTKVAISTAASAQGSVSWAKRIGSVNYDRAHALAVDRSGDVVMSGEFSTATDLGGGLISGGGMFVAKYSGADGSYRWAKVGPGIGWGVATDPNSGNVVLTGQLYGTSDFGGGPIGPGGLFLAAYGPSGNYLWAKCFNYGGYSSQDIGYGVSIDSSGNVAFTGQANSTISFDGNVVAGGSSVFVASFTSSGGYRWAKRPSGLGQGCGRAITCDGFGHTIITGPFSGTLSFDGISVTAPSLSTAALIGQYSQ